MRFTCAVILLSLFERCEAAIPEMVRDVHNPDAPDGPPAMALPVLAEKFAHTAKDMVHQAEQAVEDSIQGVIHNVVPSLEDSFVKNRITKPIDEDSLSNLLLHGTQENTDGASDTSSTSHHKKQTIDRDYTIVINSYYRHDCLRTVLDRWFECSPGEVRVVWSEGPLEIPEWLHDLEAEEKIVIDRYQTNSLSNRFHPKDFKYEAVFSVDDDITYSCSAMQAMLKVFRQDPGRMVSFAPRYITKERGYDFLKRKANTVFITKGGFSHKNLFTDFWLPEYDEVRDRVDTENQGEDLLMSFVHAMHHGNKAVGLLKSRKGSITQYDCPGELDHEATEDDKKDLHGTKSLGVTKAQRWWTKRQGLIQELFDKYGDVFQEHDSKPMSEEQAREL